ncbi:hypothetical protein [Paraburkholderia sp. Tr-20389]|uniref:hypothetical protein n=1 Tax=Paraburkholderia sp. Tr-20389 TaxID=2703903 RepID=UPI001F11DF53|nr:hypothetical protein [Paraburkholderia sp. Tr-20389]
MIELNEELIASRELRTAAYHEATHKTVYERFGGAGDAVVWKNNSGNPDERAWFGQFRPRTCPETMRRAAVTAGIPFPDLPANWSFLYGIAGLVAEEILNSETDEPSLIADAVRYRISSDEASATDLAAMGITAIDDYQLCDEDVEESVRILQGGLAGREAGGRASH